MHGNQPVWNRDKQCTPQGHSCWQQQPRCEASEQSDSRASNPKTFSSSCPCKPAAGCEHSSQHQTKELFPRPFQSQCFTSGAQQLHHDESRPPLHQTGPCCSCKPKLMQHQEVRVLLPPGSSGLQRSRTRGTSLPKAFDFFRDFIGAGSLQTCSVITEQEP